MAFRKILALIAVTLFFVAFVVLGIWTLRRVGWEPTLTLAQWWPAETFLAVEIPSLAAWIQMMDGSPIMQDLRHPSLAPAVETYHRRLIQSFDRILPPAWRPFPYRLADRRALTHIGRVGLAVWARPTDECSEPSGTWTWAWVVEAPPDVWSVLKPVVYELWQTIAHTWDKSDLPVVHTVEANFHVIASPQAWKTLQRVRAGHRPALAHQPVFRLWKRQIRGPGAYVLWIPSSMPPCLEVPPFEFRGLPIRAVTYHTVYQGGWSDTVLQVHGKGPWPDPWDRRLSSSTVGNDVWRWVRATDSLVLVVHLAQPDAWFSPDTPKANASVGVLTALLTAWSGDALVALDLQALWQRWPDLFPENRLPQLSFQTLPRLLRILGDLKATFFLALRDSRSLRPQLEAWLQTLSNRDLPFALTQTQRNPFPVYQASSPLIPTISPTLAFPSEGMVFTLHADTLNKRMVQGDPPWRMLDTFGSDRWTVFLFMDGPTTWVVSHIIPTALWLRHAPHGGIPSTLWWTILERSRRWSGHLTKVWCDLYTCTFYSRTDVVITHPEVLWWQQLLAWMGDLQHLGPTPFKP